MARKGRVEFAGAVYHVLDRGGRRQGKEVDSPVRRSHGEGEARRLFWEGLFVLRLEQEQLPEPKLAAEVVFSVEREQQE